MALIVSKSSSLISLALRANEIRFNGIDSPLKLSVVTPNNAASLSNISEVIGRSFFSIFEIKL
jgi:hypothetical protein